MIKILKDGEIHKNTKTIYSHKCSSCGCEFEFELEDFSYIEKRLNGNRGICCPFCNMYIERSHNGFDSREVEVDEND